MMFEAEKIQDNAAAAADPSAAAASDRRASGSHEARCDREARFDRFGARGLADWELVSWILGPLGSRGRDGADAAARRLLAAVGGASGLAGVPAAVLARRSGLGPGRARRVLAACELGLRAAAAAPRTGLVVRRPEDLHGLLRDEFRGLDRERFLALYLDSRHRILAAEVVSIGSLNASLVHPREVFKPAVAMSAAAVVAAHNHPSGDPRPSGDDLELTARLARCGDLLGIALLDHLVVGDEAITSIREYGWPASE